MPPRSRFAGLVLTNPETVLDLQRIAKELEADRDKWEALAQRLCPHTNRWGRGVHLEACTTCGLMIEDTTSGT